MITYTSGDILTANTEALVNTVNCVGVMGRGIALQFKHAFPENFRQYAAACQRQAVQPGRMFVFDTGAATAPRYIINFPTKRHWKASSRIEDIDAGLNALVHEIQSRNIRSIAIPPLGCGLGGLDWSRVRPRIEAALAGLPSVQVLLYEPNQAPNRPSLPPAPRVPQLTVGRAALIALMDRYLLGLLDPFISLLEVHKLLYFLQHAGEPLRLRFTKAPFGPYAENLRHVLVSLEGHLISGYADGGDAPTKPLTLVPGATLAAEKFLCGRDETRSRLERVANLVEGFETPFGLELLSTVHWVQDQEPARPTPEIIARTYAWGPRKHQFSRRQIQLAIDVLTNKGWAANQSAGQTAPG